MTTGGEWRDPHDYARLAGIDRAGIMWEWLRRDPGYVAWQVKASEATHGAGEQSTADLWGLYFRGTAVRRRARRDDYLGCSTRSWHATGRGKTGSSRGQRRRP